MSYIALIFARGGSKGLPRKNIETLAGTPLIGWAIKVAKEIHRIKRVIVSTDSTEIADIASGYGAEVPELRPAHLAQDDTPEWLAWQAALEYLTSSERRQGGVVVLPTTSPLRIARDVDNCIDEYEKGQTDVVITLSNAVRNPYFNMVTRDKKGYLSVVMENDHHLAHRQSAPDVYDVATVAYVTNASFIERSAGLFSGRVRGVLIPRERSIDIDLPLDLIIAESLMQRRMNG